ncbi:MAG TPA: hypothetical protein VGH33_08235 [Isosphaeraceae bacterium]
MTLGLGPRGVENLGSGRLQAASPSSALAHSSLGYQTPREFSEACDSEAKRQ